MSSGLDDIDTNIANYSLSELMAIAQIDDLDPNKITSITNQYINKYAYTKPDLANFFSEIQSQLLQYSASLYNPDDTDDATYPVGEEQTAAWYENEALKQNNQTQQDKITDRNQKVDVYGNAHMPMKREQLGINNTYQVDVQQDQLNPTLTNTINKFVIIDSQFRQYSGVESSSTNYTLDLNETLTNALSIKLYSYQIPYSWYVIDVQYGNTCFWISQDNINVAVSIESGNYSYTTFVTSIIDALQSAGFTFPPCPFTPPASTWPVVYNAINGKLTFYLEGGIYTPTEGDGFTISTTTNIIFFDPTSKLQCQKNCVSTQYYLNNTLGWVMGFRVPYIVVNPNIVPGKTTPLGNTAPAILDLNGSKYLMLIVDDYNQNHLNNNIVSITEYSNTIKLPSYYSPDLPYYCMAAGPTTSNEQTLINGENNATIFNNNIFPSDGGILIAGKLNVEYKKGAQVLPSAPRTLTQSQLYTINQINNNNNNNTNYRTRAPTNNDVLAILPASIANNTTGLLNIETSSSLQLNCRTYFGPVNIERLRIKLVDDKGNLINLNGSDWCFTLICQCLYQY